MMNANLPCDRCGAYQDASKPYCSVCGSSLLTEKSAMQMLTLDEKVSPENVIIRQKFQDDIGIDASPAPPITPARRPSWLRHPFVIVCVLLGVVIFFAHAHNNPSSPGGTTAGYDGSSSLAGATDCGCASPSTLTLPSPEDTMAEFCQAMDNTNNAPLIDTLYTSVFGESPNALAPGIPPAGDTPTCGFTPPARTDKTATTVVTMCNSPGECSKYTVSLVRDFDGNWRIDNLVYSATSQPIGS